MPKRRGDYWEIDAENGIAIKHHVRKRQALFNPKNDQSADSPQQIGSWQKRSTQINYLANRPAEQFEDNWQSKKQVEVLHFPREIRLRCSKCCTCHAKKQPASIVFNRRRTSEDLSGGAPSAALATQNDAEVVFDDVV